MGNMAVMGVEDKTLQSIAMLRYECSCPVCVCLLMARSRMESLVAEVLSKLL
jgi:hypothetical protein